MKPIYKRITLIASYGLLTSSENIFRPLHPPWLVVTSFLSDSWSDKLMPSRYYYRKQRQRCSPTHGCTTQNTQTNIERTRFHSAANWFVVVFVRLVAILFNFPDLILTML
jgi:hypothetical protein